MRIEVGTGPAEPARERGGLAPVSVALAVVIPATDRPATLARCRTAIESQLEAGDRLEVVEDCRRPGPAAARNEGVRRAGSECEVLVFVDADVVIAPGGLARIRSAFASDPGLAALFGSYDDCPEAAGLVSRFRNLLHHHTHQRGAGVASTFWAGLGAVRRAAFEAAGGFDEARYRRASIEDIDLGVRLAADGLRIELDPALQGTHLKLWRLRDMLRTDLLDRGVPWVELMLRRGEARDELNLGWRNRLSALAALGALAGLLARRPRISVLAATAVAALNPGLYLLLWRRLGAGAVPALSLHLVHLVTAALALPLAAARSLRGRGADPEPGPIDRGHCVPRAAMCLAPRRR